MAQYTISPPTTRKELVHAADLLRGAMRQKGLRSITEVSRVTGMALSDVSRLLSARVERKWGYFRLKRIADFVGVTLDGLLGRPAGTTEVLGPKDAPPTATVKRERMARDAEETAIMAETASRSLADSAKVLREVSKHAEAIRKLLSEKG